MGKKEFATIALDLKHEDFIVHVAALSVDSGDEVHSSRKAQIAHLKADEAPTKVLSSEYADFLDIFSSNLATELSEYTRINNHTIKFRR